MNNPLSFWRNANNEPFVNDLAHYLKDKRVLEVFAGNGLMAHLLSQQGVCITATSLFKGYDLSSFGRYHAIEEIDCLAAINKYQSNHDVLLMIWPEATSMAFKAASVFFSLDETLQKEIVFIGEKTNIEKGILGGCATDEFFEVFDQVAHRFLTYKGRSIEVAEALRNPFSKI